MKLVKKLLKGCLERMGYAVYRIDSNAKQNSNSPGLPVYSPMEHNSVQRINEFYANPELRALQLTPTRFMFYDEILDIALANGVVFDGLDICDVGCGTGHLLSYVQQRFTPHSLTGLDISLEAIKVAQEILPKATFRELDIYAGTPAADVLLCSEVLEHLLYPDRTQANY